MEETTSRAAVTRAKGLARTGASGLKGRQAKACETACIARLLYAHLHSRLQAEGLMKPLLVTEMPLVPVLAAMESVGVAFDPRILQQVKVGAAWCRPCNVQCADPFFAPQSACPLPRCPQAASAAFSSTLSQPATMKSYFIWLSLHRCHLSCKLHFVLYIGHGCACSVSFAVAVCHPTSLDGLEIGTCNIIITTWSICWVMRFFIELSLHHSHLPCKLHSMTA